MGTTKCPHKGEEGTAKADIGPALARQFQGQWALPRRGRGGLQRDPGEALLPQDLQKGEMARPC